jgi:hypothetical protein
MHIEVHTILAPCFPDKQTWKMTSYQTCLHNIPGLVADVPFRFFCIPALPIYLHKGSKYPERLEDSLNHSSEHNSLETDLLIHGSVRPEIFFPT